MGCGSSNGQNINEEFVIHESEESTPKNTSQRKSRKSTKNETKEEYPPSKTKLATLNSETGMNDDQTSPKVRTKKKKDTKTISLDPSLSPKEKSFPKEKISKGKRNSSESPEKIKRDDVYSLEIQDINQMARTSIECNSRVQNLFLNSFKNLFILDLNGLDQSIVIERNSKSEMDTVNIYSQRNSTFTLSRNSGDNYPRKDLKLRTLSPEIKKSKNFSIAVAHDLYPNSEQNVKKFNDSISKDEFVLN